MAKIGLALMLILFCTQARAADFLYLTASWYAEKDLKSSGQWAITKGVMANNEQFDETALTCATRDFALGDYLRVSTLDDSRVVVVRVTDRINKRFKGKRIDLTKKAFSLLAPLLQGLVKVKVEKTEVRND